MLAENEIEAALDPAKLEAGKEISVRRGDIGELEKLDFQSRLEVECRIGVRCLSQ